MKLRLSTLLSLAVGALLIAAPGLDSTGDGLSYNQAFAAKGGNGKGKGGENGNRGSNSSQSASNGKSNNSSKASTSTEDATSVASLDSSSKKVKGPDHPSSLGRWNATKNFEHPSIQAHIRNGNFNGTIGMLAHFGMALNTLGEMQADAAAAEAASAELSAMLQGLGYGLPDLTDPTVDPAATFDLDLAISQFKAAAPLADTATMDQINSLISTVENAPSEEDLAAAQGELTSAEEEMAAASNRAPWEEVRSVVIDRLGLQDVTVTEPTPSEPTAPSEPTTVGEPAPVVEPVL
jgi:hypothetical protein